MRRLLLVSILALAVAAPRLQAQEAPYRFDMGAQVGMSGYLGDASSSIFSHPGFCGGISFRYLPSVRWDVRVLMNVMSLSGDTRSMSDVLPGGANYKFHGTAYDLGGRIEFNFFAYGIGETYKKLRRWTPYLTMGMGLTVASAAGQTAAGFNIPMGVGMKYKLSKRLNAGLEFTMTKVFNDHVDGPLADLQQIKSSFGKNTDWYSNICVSITYEFGERCAACHYVD